MRLPQLDLNRLQTFFAVAEHGGVSAAAHRLALTPSAVSQQLARLEESLDVRLFDRVGRRLVLTREGRLLNERFRVHQERLRETLAELVEPDAEPRGTLRVGLFLGFPRAPLASFFARFVAAHPRVTLRVIYAPHRELDAGLEAGRVDFAFSLRPDAEGSNAIAATHLFEQELLLVAGRKLVPRAFDFDTLHALPLVDYYQGDPLIARWIRHHFRRKPPRLQVRAWAATTNLALDLILEHAGAGVLPSHVAQPYLARRRLRALTTARPPLRDAIWLKERAGGYRGPALEAFRNAALEAFASLDG